jgi:hypothetical protein
MDLEENRIKISDRYARRVELKRQVEKRIRENKLRGDEKFIRFKMVEEKMHKKGVQKRVLC